MKLRRHRGAVVEPLGPELVDLIEGPRRTVPFAELDAVGEGSLTTPFEDWCESTGTHPEAFGAWEQFSAERRPAS